MSYDFTETEKFLNDECCLDDLAYMLTHSALDLAHIVDESNVPVVQHMQFAVQTVYEFLNTIKEKP